MNLCKMSCQGQCNPAKVNYNQVTITQLNEAGFTLVDNYLDIPKQQKEEKMYENKVDLADRAQKHLRNRAEGIFQNHRSDLRKKFYMDQDDAPQSPKELAKRIADGAFRVHKPDSDQFDHWMSWAGHIEWRTHDADEAGYNAARKVLDKAYTDIKDVILVKDAEAGLEALKAFESATFS